MLVLETVEYLAKTYPVLPSGTRGVSKFKEMYDQLVLREKVSFPKEKKFYKALISPMAGSAGQVTRKPTEKGADMLESGVESRKLQEARRNDRLVNIRSMKIPDLARENEILYKEIAEILEETPIDCNITPVFF